MQLAQGTRSRERGFAMAGLLVGIALLSLGLSVAMPTWKTMAQREKEEELIWRGQQYDRAIQLYRKKNAAPGAPSVDKLVEGRFLRKKYKDPITNGDFEIVGVSQAGNAPGVQQPARGFGQLVGGVRSKSKAKSLRVLNGRYGLQRVAVHLRAMEAGRAAHGTWRADARRKARPTHEARRQTWRKPAGLGAAWHRRLQHRLGRPGRAAPTPVSSFQ